MTTTRWSIGRRVALVACVAAISGSLALASGSAFGAWVDVAENGAPGHLSLRSDPMPASFPAMSPGSIEYWQVNANLVDERAALTLQIERDGALAARPDGLQLLVQSCATEWTGFPSAPRCAAPTTVLGPLPASSFDLGPLGPLDAAVAPAFTAGMLGRDAGSFLLVTLSIPDTPQARADESLMGIEATLGLRFTASGLEPGSPNIPVPNPRVPDVSPPGGLTTSGTDALAVILLAAGAVALGLVLSGARRRKVRS